MSAATGAQSPITLESLKRKERTKPPTIIVYGPGGVGKTTLAVGAPDPVLLAVEDGIGILDVPHWPIASFAELMQAIGVLYSEEHEFRSLILDSLDWAEPLIWAETCRRHGWGSIEEVPYGRGFLAALTVWGEALEGLSALRNERGMMVILLAHHLVKTFKDPTADPYDRYQLKLNDKAAALLVEVADVVGFLSYRVSVREERQGKNVLSRRGVGAGARVLHLEERPAFIAKCRYCAPASIDLPNSADPQVLWPIVGEHFPAPDTNITE